MTCASDPLCHFCNLTYDRCECAKSDNATRVARNAGPETITVWTDGGWKVWGLRDAEVATLCEPGKVLLNIRLDTLDSVDFRPLQESVSIAEWALIGRLDPAPDIQPLTNPRP